MHRSNRTLAVPYEDRCGVSGRSRDGGPPQRTCPSRAFAGVGLLDRTSRDEYGMRFLALFLASGITPEAASDWRVFSLLSPRGGYSGDIKNGLYIAFRRTAMNYVSREMTSRRLKKMHGCKTHVRDAPLTSAQLTRRSIRVRRGMNERPGVFLGRLIFRRPSLEIRFVVPPRHSRPLFRSFVPGALFHTRALKCQTVHVRDAPVRRDSASGDRLPRGPASCRCDYLSGESRSLNLAITGHVIHVLPIHVRDKGGRDSPSEAYAALRNRREPLVVRVAGEDPRSPMEMLGDATDRRYRLSFGRNRLSSVPLFAGCHRDVRKERIKRNCVRSRGGSYTGSP